MLGKLSHKFNFLNLLLIGFIVVFVLGNYDFCFAADTQVEKGSRASAKPRGMPFNGTVKFVDPQQSFVVLEGKSARKFFVSPQTKIKIDGVEGKLNQIEAGKYIGGYAREESENHWVATTINIYSNRTKTNSTSSVKVNPR